MAAKDRAFPPKPPAPPAPPGFFTRKYREFFPPKPKPPPPPPTLGLVPRYVITTQHLAIICSLGVVYPGVAIVGLLKLVTDILTAPKQLAAQLANPELSQRLAMDGLSGLPVGAAIAVMAVNAGLLFFVLGPFGMAKMPSAYPMLVLSLGAIAAAIASRKIARTHYAVIERCYNILVNRFVSKMTEELQRLGQGAGVVEAGEVEMTVQYKNQTIADYVEAYTALREDFLKRRAAEAATVAVAPQEAPLLDREEDDDEER